MTALSQLVAWVLAGFYSVVPNYAVAIILLGLTFMAMIVPLTLKSTRSMLAMQKLQPKMKQLQQQHKNDRLALNQALTELYKEEGVSPFGSCLPTLLPLPLFYVLYRVIRGLSNTTCYQYAKVAGKSVCRLYTAKPLYLNTGTKLYTHLIYSVPHIVVRGVATAKPTPPPAQAAAIHAFGINLATSAWSAISDHLGIGAIFGSLLLLIIMIGANYYQQVQIMNLNPMVKQNQQANPQMAMMRYFPILFGLICLRLPAGLVLYYAVSALFRVGQQWMMYRYDPKVKALVTRDDRDIEVLEARLEEKDSKPQPKPQTRPQPKPQTRPQSRPQPTDKLRKPAPSLPPGRGGTTGNGQVNAKQPGRYAGAPGNSQRNRNRRRKGR